MRISDWSSDVCSSDLYASLFWTIILAAVIGVILASAFSAILVYATDLVPGKVGMIAGLFFGFAFGMGGIGSALLGWLADHTSIGYVFKVCAFLPLRSEEHTSELQSLMRISYAVFC